MHGYDFITMIRHIATMFNEDVVAEESDGIVLAGVTRHSKEDLRDIEDVRILAYNTETNAYLDWHRLAEFTFEPLRSVCELQELINYIGDTRYWDNDKEVETYYSDLLGGSYVLCEDHYADIKRQYSETDLEEDSSTKWASVTNIGDCCICARDNAVEDFLYSDERHAALELAYATGNQLQVDKLKATIAGHKPRTFISDDQTVALLTGKGWYRIAVYLKQETGWQEVEVYEGYDDPNQPNAPVVEAAEWIKQCHDYTYNRE